MGEKEQSLEDEGQEDERDRAVIDKGEKREGEHVAR